MVPSQDMPSLLITAPSPLKFMLPKKTPEKVTARKKPKTPPNALSLHQSKKVKDSPTSIQSEVFRFLLKVCIEQAWFLSLGQTHPPN